MRSLSSGKFINLAAHSLSLFIEKEVMKLYFSGIRSEAISKKDIGAFYGVNRTNRINDYQLSDCKNMDCDAFPYFATRRKREVFYDENKMSAICHDTDIENEYAVTGITEDGNFVYRGNRIYCAGELAGNDYVCEYLGDYVCFPKQQVIASSQAYNYDAPVREVYSFRQKTEASVYFKCHIRESQSCGYFFVSGAKGEFRSNCSEWGTILKSAVANGKLMDGMCFVPVFRSCHNVAEVKTTALPCPESMFMRVDYVEADGFSFTCYDAYGNEFDYTGWLTANKEYYSGSNFPLSVTFEDSFVRLELGVSTAAYISATELQLDYVSAPMLWGVPYGGRLFACDVFGVDIFYTSGSGAADEKYDFTPGTSLGGAGFVSCADHGRWTALIPFGGALYAFKRDGMYRIYSSDGLNFYMDKVCDVGALSARSVCVVSDVMYFLSENGFYKFTGSYPALLPANLSRRYTDGVLGGVDNKLYASVVSDEGCEFVVYDARVDAYGVHDDFNALNFVTYGGELYALSNSGEVYHFSDCRESVEFELLTRKFFLGFEKKAINAIRLYFDFSGEENEKIEVFVSYDGGEWEPCFKPITSGKLKYVPIKFKKCDELCVKIKGNGIFTLKGMTISFYSGGDIKQNR